MERDLEAGKEGRREEVGKQGKKCLKSYTGNEKKKLRNASTAELAKVPIHNVIRVDERRD